MELRNRRVIYVDRPWFDKLEQWLEPEERVADSAMPFMSLRFLTPRGQVIVFALHGEKYSADDYHS